MKREDDCVGKQILKMAMLGKKKRGTQCRRLMDVVREDTRDMEVIEEDVAMEDMRDKEEDVVVRAY